MLQIYPEMRSILDFAREGDGIEGHSILKILDQIDLPSQSLDLPSTESKCDDRAQGQSNSDRAPAPPARLSP